MKRNYQNFNKLNKTEELTNILNDAMVNLKKIVDVNTVVGVPIKNDDGTVIIPVSKVYVGIVSGGGELNRSIKDKTYDYPFAGGTGSGFTVVPMGFLVTSGGVTSFVSTEIDKSSEKLIEMTNRTLKIILQNLKKD